MSFFQHPGENTGRPVAAQYCATFLKPEMLHIYRQIKGLSRFLPVVFTQKRENADQFPFEPLVILPRPRTRELRRFWMRKILHSPVKIYRSEARRLETELRQKGAQLVHIYFGHIAVQLLPFMERKALPMVVSFHGADVMVELDQPKHRQASQRMLELADLVLARSESLVQGLIALGCPPAKIRLHRTGIPLAAFPFHQRSMPVDGAWHFVQASRLIAKKGLPTTLRAFAAFAAKYPQARLTIAGEGPLLEELRRMAGELKVAERVTFAGFLRQAALKDLYESTHAFVHPSELGADGNQEGVPNSMLEAMASGLPVLATNHGGIPEAVTSGKSGVLVAEGDHAALTEAMLSLASNPEPYRAMSAEAHREVSEKFEQSAQIQKLESYYEEAMHGSSPGAALK
ncbi:MAG: glycosyltransferase [Chthoniobacteraceae bacterium]